MEEKALGELRAFSDEEISYRTFTLFNFLGENGQGVLNNFFDKCRYIKYQIKLPSILNYIFNRNLPRIFELKKKEEWLKRRIEELEGQASKNIEIISKVNAQLEVLNIPSLFNGRNANEINAVVYELQQLGAKEGREAKFKAISELEIIYNSISDQIKVQTNEQRVYSQFERENINRKELLEKLYALVDSKPEFDYMINPMLSIISDLDKSISFNRYAIRENTISALKKQLDGVKHEILRHQSKFKLYSVSDKSRAITLVLEYLPMYECDYDPRELEKHKKELREVREELKALQNSNDIEKIDTLSGDVTRLYRSASQTSELVKTDIQNDGFFIKYIKNGNMLQPQIAVEEYSEKRLQDFYTGSMARHTLIQLCGYIAFLRLLVNDNKYPIIPILVVDHLSKPFAPENIKAIGSVLTAAYNELDKTAFQIILFEDKDDKTLGVQADKYTELVDEDKTGFNPFYFERT